MNIEQEIEGLKQQIASLEKKQVAQKANELVDKNPIEEMKWYVVGDGNIRERSCVINSYFIEIHKQGRTFRTKEGAEALAKYERLHTAMMSVSDGWVTGEDKLVWVL